MGAVEARQDAAGSAGAGGDRFEFTIPVVATNLLIEYAAFHESSSASSEKLQCPRCSRTVTDKHGICKHCGDNAYQCRHCRNINYEKLDAFLCNECGFCKHARFDFTLVVRPSYVVERITNEAEREKLLALIDAELANASKRYTQLVNSSAPSSDSSGNQPMPSPSSSLPGVVLAAGCEPWRRRRRGAPAAAPPAPGTGPSPSAAGDPTETLLASLPGAATLRMQRKISILAMLYSRGEQGGLRVALQVGASSAGCARRAAALPAVQRRRAAAHRCTGRAPGCSALTRPRQLPRPCWLGRRRRGELRMAHEWEVTMGAEAAAARGDGVTDSPAVPGQPPLRLRVGVCAPVPRAARVDRR